MAELPTIEFVIRCAFRWENPNFDRNAITVMHFNTPDWGIAGLRTAIEANVLGDMWDHASTDSAIVDVTYTPLDGTTASQTIATSGGSKWNGNSGSGDQVPQAAVVVKHLTLDRGRSARGRNFLPWPVEPNVNNGVLNSASVGVMNTAWESFRSDMLADTYPLVVASYKDSAAGDVTSSTVESLLGTQRRRQPRPN